MCLGYADLLAFIQGVSFTWETFLHPFILAKLITYGLSHYIHHSPDLFFASISYIYDSFRVILPSSLIVLLDGLLLTKSCSKLYCVFFSLFLIAPYAMLERPRWSFTVSGFTILRIEGDYLRIPLFSLLSALAAYLLIFHFCFFPECLMDISA